MHKSARYHRPLQDQTFLRSSYCDVTFFSLRQGQAFTHFARLSLKSYCLIFLSRLDLFVILLMISVQVHALKMSLLRGAVPQNLCNPSGKICC